MQTAFCSSIALAAMVVLAAAPVGAQTPPADDQKPPEPPPYVAEPPPDMDLPRRADEITLAGCLQRVPKPDGPDTFVLTHPVAGEVPGEAAPAGPAAAGDRPRSGPAAYELVAANSTVRLADHVGHHVQVSGRLQSDEGDLTAASRRPAVSRGAVTPAAPDRPDRPKAPEAEEPAVAPSGSPATAFVVTAVQTLENTCRDTPPAPPKP